VRCFPFPDVLISLDSGVHDLKFDADFHLFLIMDELGSGMRNTYNYTKLYSGAEPTFIEGDVFRTIVPLHEAATTTVGPFKVPKSHDDTLDDTLELRILSLIKIHPRINQRELSQQLEVSLPTIKRVMSDMVKKGILERKGGKRYGHWELKTR
jgi:ATP-dependent DNA helicase RecG